MFNIEAQLSSVCIFLYQCQVSLLVLLNYFSKWFLIDGIGKSVFHTLFNMKTICATLFGRLGHTWQSSGDMSGILCLEVTPGDDQGTVCSAKNLNQGYGQHSCMQGKYFTSLTQKF